MGVIDYEPPKIVLDRHIDKLVDKELGNFHNTKDDFDEQEIKKDIVKLERFKMVLEVKYKRNEGEEKEEVKVDIPQLIKDN